MTFTISMTDEALSSLEARFTAMCVADPVLVTELKQESVVKLEMPLVVSLFTRIISCQSHLDRQSEDSVSAFQINQLHSRTGAYHIRTPLQDKTRRNLWSNVNSTALMPSDVTSPPSYADNLCIDSKVYTTQISLYIRYHLGFMSRTSISDELPLVP